jgi:NADH-quinone oxidoreductase subunit H
MEALIALIQKMPGAADMSAQALHITAASVMATLMFVVMAMCAIVFTWMERKVAGFLQNRYGPMRTGRWHGWAQAVADMLKILGKEDIIPAEADKGLFVFAPILVLLGSLLAWAAIPWAPGFVAADLDLGLFYIFAVSSLVTIGVLMAGWSSNNKYAMMGGLRSTAQMISYELALGLSFVTAILLANSMRMLDIVEAQKNLWFVIIQPIGTGIFLIATLAEVNRAPFDMPEAEQELTAGYHTEYSGMKFALLFMAEYTKMISISAIGATLFFGGYREFWFLSNTIFSIDQTPWLGPIYMFAKLIILLFGMIWLRATYPRIRYDRLMAFGWKILLPLSLALVFITAVGIMMAENINPAYMWSIPILSILVGLFAIGSIDRELRRKDNARR